MSNVNIFEAASRQKLRFPSVRGELTAEQLWDLPLTARNDLSLDAVARAVNTELRASTTESFVATVRNAKADDYAVCLEIVKHIIAVRLEENANRTAAAARAAQREKIMSIMASKQDQVLEGKTLEELQAELLALG
jgi:hypothetical protein